MTSHRLGPLTVITVAMALLLAACGADPTATPTPTPLPQAEPTPTLDAAARFEAEWAALIKAAQEEGEVSLSFNTGAGRRYRPVAEFFQEKFGIRTVISVGSGSASANRILAERTNGQFLVDIMYAGITTANTRMLPANVLAPVADFLIHPEVTDESLWFGGKHAYSDPEQKYVFVYAANAGATNLGMHYNTDLVSQADIDALNSVFDFLDPKWKSKIVAYSPSGGGGGSYFQAYVHPEIGTEWIDRFVSPELDVTFTQDILFIVNGVTQGKFHMCVSWEPWRARRGARQALQGGWLDNGLLQQHPGPHESTASERGKALPELVALEGGRDDAAHARRGGAARHAARGRDRVGRHEAECPPSGRAVVLRLQW